MKQKLFLFLALILMFVLLIGLNTVSYVQKEKIPDTEDSPNRSTYNVGATGTRAFYDLLAETGAGVMRWQEPFPDTGVFDANQFSTFVIIGRTRKKISYEEVTNIMNWVSAGGTLVIIDRDPTEGLVTTTSDWDVSITYAEDSTFMVDPNNQNEMVGKTSAVKPVQPTLFTAEINAVQPSKFASSIYIRRILLDDEATEDEFEVSSQDESNDDGVDLAKEKTVLQAPVENVTTSEEDGVIDSEDTIKSGNEEVDELFLKAPKPSSSKSVVRTNIVESYEYRTQNAPVIHLSNETDNLLVDIPFDAGQVVYLADPYIASNSGIRLVDNAQLLTNIVTSKGGLIAFDEFHQGYGKNENRLFQYFSGTPVMAISLQLILLVGLLFYSQSRRFARALPDEGQNRLSKLEYVSAMAQLQGRTKAYDLAIENIYKDFRRRVSRLFSIDNQSTTHKELAEKIAERLNRSESEIEKTLFKCEDIMHGEPTKKKEIVGLISELREIEKSLGLRRGKERKARK